MTRLDALERIAVAAQLVRDLEKALTSATDARAKLDSLVIARLSLDKALLDLARLGQDE